MENKQLVTIKVGSIFKYYNGIDEIVEAIHKKTATVYFESGEFDLAKMPLNKHLKSINSIPVEQISEVLVASEK